MAEQNERVDQMKWEIKEKDEDSENKTEIEAKEKIYRQCKI